MFIYVKLWQFFASINEIQDMSNIRSLDGIDIKLLLIWTHVNKYYPFVLYIFNRFNFMCSNSHKKLLYYHIYVYIYFHKYFV